MDEKKVNNEIEIYKPKAISLMEEGLSTRAIVNFLKIESKKIFAEWLRSIKVPVKIENWNDSKISILIDSYKKGAEPYKLKVRFKLESVEKVIELLKQNNVYREPKQNSNTINFTDQKFGRLIAKRSTENKKQERIWECLCDCGNIKNVKAIDLKNGTVISCGCAWKEKTAANLKAKAKYPSRIKAAQAHVFMRYSDGDLCLDDFLNLSKQNCYYCGDAPSNKYNKQCVKENEKQDAVNDFIYNGLDRINSLLLHNEDNVVPCCYICNTMKSNSSQKDFLTLIFKTAIHLNLWGVKAGAQFKNSEIPKNRLNLVNKTFGSLKVISMAYVKDSRTYWNCKCTCGNDFVALGKSLVSGNTASCGCLKFPYNTYEILGKEYNRWTIIEKSNFDKNGHQLWKAKCTCGTEKIETARYFVKGIAKSCGCLSNEGLKERNDKKHIESLINMWDTCAKIVWSDVYEEPGGVTLEEFKILSQMKCTYCGVAPAGGKDRFNGNFVYNGLDRQDSNKGHTFDNCVPCCFPCNRLKNKFSLEVFFDKIRKISNKFDLICSG